MYWIFLTLLASFVFAFENIIDKKTSDLTKNTQSALFLMNASKIPIIVFLGVYWYSYIYINVSVFLWSLLIGAIATVTGFIYLKVFKEEEVSIAMPIYELGPIIALSLEFLILGTRPHGWQYLAFIFLILGGLTFSFQKPRLGKVSWRSFLNKTLFLVLTASFGYNLMYVITKYVIGENNLETTFFLHTCAYIVFSLLYPIIYSKGKCIWEISEIAPYLLGISVFAQSIGIIWYILYTQAFTAGSVALVQALGSTQSLFVLLFSFWLTVFFPSILREKWHKAAIFQKSIGTLLITIWVYLMYLAS
jgi:drug/metabolite transporter (DMT)-like permease